MLRFCDDTEDGRWVFVLMLPVDAEDGRQSFVLRFCDDTEDGRWVFVSMLPVHAKDGRWALS